MINAKIKNSKDDKIVSLAFSEHLTLYITVTFVTATYITVEMVTWNERKTEGTG